MRPIHHVAEPLAQRGHPAGEGRLGNRAGTWRDVHCHALARHHLLCPVEMVRVADQQAAVHAVGVHDDGNPLGGLVGVATLSFGDQVYIRNAARLQIVASNLAFAVLGIFARAAGGDDDRSQSALKKVVSMVQARAIHRRRMAHVLRRAEHHDGIGGTGLVDAAFAHDLPTGVQQKPHRNDGGYGYDPAGKWRVGGLYRRGAYSWPPKSSRICSSGMAPCRITRQLPSSLVRSMMVEGMSRGDWPPSTMMDKQSPSWSRTCKAEVHSLSPLRLAEVAVIGMPPARMMASGISAAGTRKATLPVLAVTLSGSLGSAFTMMVSGPGQKRRASR